jgi:4-amino-4-deoxy-L-arabinose transferase-like glycosyltransferase
MMPGARIARRILPALFLLALVLRGAYVAAMPPDESFGDQAEMRALAKNLIARGAYTNDGSEPQINRMPGLPAFLAALLTLFGSTRVPMQVLNIIFAGALVFVVYTLARPAFGQRTALWAAGLTLAYPAFTFYTLFEQTEILYTLLLAINILCIIRFLDTHKARWFFTAVLLFAAGAYLRGEHLLLGLLFIVVAGLAKHVRFARKYLYLGIAVALLIAAMLPWTIRNAAAAGYPAPFEAFGGPLGLWYTAHTSLMPDAELAAYKHAHFANMTTLQKRELALNEWKELLRAQPSAYARGTLRNVYTFWVGSHTVAHGFLSRVTFRDALAAGDYGVAAVKAALFAITTALGMLGLAGLVVFRKRPYAALFALPVLFKVVLHAFIGAELRYQIPIMPFVIIFATALLVKPRPSSQAPAAPAGRISSEGTRR